MCIQYCFAASKYLDWKSDSDDSSADSASSATAVLDDLRSLVHAAERERGVDLLESFEHFDRRGQVRFMLQNYVLEYPPTETQ